MVSPIDSTTNTTSATTLATPSTQKPMDREAFLKLLVAQISHQDPLQPMEGTEFVSQLSQFAMVEQSIAQSSKLDVLSTQMTGLGNNEATALVGKKVSVRGHAIAFDGSTPTGSSVTLSGPAAKVTVSIQDANGKTVRTLNLGARAAGVVSVNWDGKDDSGTTAAKGSYTAKVEATDASGKAVSSTSDVTGTVTKVSFDKGYPELLLDSGALAPISDLVAVENAPVAR